MESLNFPKKENCCIVTKIVKNFARVYSGGSRGRKGRHHPKFLHFHENWSNSRLEAPLMGWPLTWSNYIVLILSYPLTLRLDKILQQSRNIRALVSWHTSVFQSPSTCDAPSTTVSRLQQESQHSNSKNFCQF